MLILYILLAILFVSMMVLLSKIKVFFEYNKRPGEKLYKEILIKFWFVPIRIKKKGPSKKKDKPSNENEDKKSIIQKIKDAKDIINSLKTTYSKSRRNIRKGFRIENASLHFRIGLGDAANTGIATGAMWALLYDGLAFCDYVGAVKSHYFEVAPDYKEEGFESVGKIKLSFRVIDALIIALRFLHLTYKNNKKQK